MAPEMYEEKGYSEKVDIYAFGMCMLEMATGEYPYSECKNAAQIYKKVTQGLRPDCLAKVEDKELLSIINQCLSVEAERWSARRLLDYFFAEDPDVMLLSSDEQKSKLTLQVVFKGTEKQSIKFDFRTQNDTPEIVVQEMVRYTS
jgi:serine/threonine protein kinase